MHLCELDQFFVLVLKFALSPCALFCEVVRMVRRPLRLHANFKVKCFGSRRNVNGIDKYVPLDPQSGMEEVEIVFETRLEDSASRPVCCDVPASDATVESALIGSIGRKCHRRSLCLALATIGVEEIDDSGALRKKR
jgi:hypothetical protein